MPRRVWSPALAALCLSLAAASRLLAVGSPPLITDDPGTPGDRHWEINVGFSTERRAGERLSELPLLDLNYGIGDSLQLKYEVPYLVRRADGEARVSGWGDSGLGVKWRFHDSGEKGFALSVYPQIEFNTPGSSADDSSLVESGSVFLLPFQFEKELGPVTLNLQVGREFRKDGDAWFYGAALSRRLNDRMAFGVELAGTAASGLERSALTLNVGFTVDVSERVSFMVSIGRELHNHEEPRATLVGYVGWQFRR